MSDNEPMTGAIIITILALTSAVVVLGTLLVVNRPDEGWRAWFMSAFDALRSDELEWRDALDLDDEMGDLRTLAQLSEPGDGYASTDGYLLQRERP